MGINCAQRWERRMGENRPSEVRASSLLSNNAEDRWRVGAERNE